MKLLMTGFLFLLLSINAKADCYRDFCIGDKVSDDFGNRGVVHSFVFEKSEVIVLLSNIYLAKSYYYDFIGRAVPCLEEICIGSEVYDPYKDLAIINEVYSNGIVFLFDKSLNKEVYYHISEVILNPKK